MGVFSIDPDDQSSELLPLKELAKRLPAVRNGKPIAVKTIYRWATTGLKSRMGQRIRLEHEFIGGTICASVDAVHRLGKQKNDREWQEIPLTTQRERNAIAKRAADAAARIRKKFDI